MANAPTPPLLNPKSNSNSKKTTKLTTNAHGVLLAILIETAGIVVVVTVAGIDESIANMMLILAIGMWLLYLVMNADTVATYSQKLTNIERGAAQ